LCKAYTVAIPPDSRQYNAMFTHAVVMHIVAGIHTHACAYRVKHMEEAPRLDSVRESIRSPNDFARSNITWSPRDTGPAF